MSKPKLSPEQKETIRKEIKGRLSNGTPRPQVIRDLAEKYGLTPAAVAYYLNGSKKRKKSKPISLAA